MTIARPAEQQQSGRAESPARPDRSHRRRSPVPYLFAAPYAIFLIAFGIAPTVYGAITSLFARVPGSGGEREFAPTDTWGSVFTDYRLADAVGNVGKYLLMWLPAMLLLIFALALTLHARPGKFAGAMRLTYYLPGAVTGSAAALLWAFMVSPSASPFGWVLELLGVDSAAEAIALHTPVVISLMGIAIHAGGWILIIYAALASLPTEVLEAARIDGANAWQVAIRVKLPMVGKYVALVLIATFAAATQVFVEPTVLAAAAPGQISSTWSINQLAYYFATQRADFGKAAALSLALLLIGLVVALFVVYRTKFYRLERG